MFTEPTMTVPDETFMSLFSAKTDYGKVIKA